jgi:signal transduction histidine kinase
MVGSRLDAINKARHRLIVLLAIAVPGSFITAGLLVYLVSYIGLRGMRRLTAEADDLSTAVPIKQLGQQSTFELQELADHLNAMLARLGEASRNEHTFIAAASHDLRGSLANVLSQIEYAALLPPGDEQHRQVLVAKDSVQQATQYLNDLLNASRLRGGPVSSEDQEPIDLARLSEHVASAARERFPEKILTISGAATVLADPTDARQAVSNLIDNAARHAEQRVDVVLASVDHTATISIRDDGPGYPDRVLQTFHDPLPRYGNLKVGSGLGLMTARDAARRNGGEVELRNTAPGAEAVLRLPATSSPFDDDEDDAENAGGAG